MKDWKRNKYRLRRRIHHHRNFRRIRHHRNFRRILHWMLDIHYFCLLIEVNF